MSDLVINQVVRVEDKSGEIFENQVPVANDTVTGRTDRTSADIAKTNDSYDDMRVYWQLMDDIGEGSLYMRDWAYRVYTSRSPVTKSLSVIGNNIYNGGYRIDYFPPKPEEEPEEYYKRVDKLVMAQYVGKTLKTFKGIVFRKPTMITGSLPEKLQKFKKNVDGKGSDLNYFSEQVLGVALEKGHAFVMLETAYNQDGEINYSESREKVRSWFTLVEPEDVLDWEHTVDSDGQLVLNYVKIKRNSFSNTPEIVQIYRSGYFEIHRKEKDSEVYYLYAEGEHGFPEIPLFCVYGHKLRRRPEFVSRPPLFEQALLQIKDMQIISDYDSGVEMGCYTNIVITGASSDEFSVSGGLGPNRVIILNSPDAQMKQVVTNSAGIESARQAIQENKTRIYQMGINFLTEQVAHTRTTKAQVDSTREAEVSPLISVARSLQDALNKAFRMFKKIEFIEDENDEYAISVNDDLNILSIDPQTADLILKMVSLGQLSYETMLETFKRGEILPSTVDASAELKKINGQENQERVEAAIKGENPDLFIPKPALDSPSVPPVDQDVE